MPSPSEPRSAAWEPGQTHLPPEPCDPPTKPPLKPSDSAQSVRTPSAATQPEFDYMAEVKRLKAIEMAAMKLLDYVPTTGVSLRAGYGPAREELRRLIHGE